MNNDYSWLGLHRKGYMLQYRHKQSDIWHDVVGILAFCLSEQAPIIFRYKHSIQ